MVGFCVGVDMGGTFTEFVLVDLAWSCTCGRPSAASVSMRASLYSRGDLGEAIRPAATKAVPVAPVVSRKIPLEDPQRRMEEALGGGPVTNVLVEI